MLRASGASAEVLAGQVPLLSGVEKQLSNGIFPGGSQQNLNYIESHTTWAKHVSRELKLCLADAQTSGGLLISLPENQAMNLLKDLRNAGCLKAEIIGSILNKSDKAMYVR